jgi:hypothetical protein
MKKRLEAELISIAHRILKLKNKSELTQLHAETQKLYETLSVLKFVENNINIVQPKIDVQDLEEKLTIAFDAQTINAEVEKIQPDEQFYAVVKEKKVPDIELEIEEVVKPHVEHIEVKTTTISEEIKIEFEPLFELSIDETEKITENRTPKQLFEDLLGHDYNNLTFEKVTVTKSEVVEFSNLEVDADEVKIDENLPNKNEKETVLEEVDTIKNDASTEILSKNITFGLNDRIGFEKHLFGGSSEDMNRVISQLSTYDTLEEAEDFIKDMVKPDYNDWLGKEDYEARFMDIAAKKFN